MFIFLAKTSYIKIIQIGTPLDEIKIQILRVLGIIAINKHKLWKMVCKEIQFLLLLWGFTIKIN